MLNFVDNLFVRCCVAFVQGDRKQLKHKFLLQ
jgi:hypothetical protein